MSDVRFHAKHIILDQNPGVALRHVNTKLLYITDNKEKFTFLKMVSFYATRRLSDYEWKKQELELNAVNPDHPENSNEEVKTGWALQIKAAEIAIRNYKNVLTWCINQIDLLNKELSIIEKFNDNWKSSIGPEYIQLPANFDLGALKQASSVKPDLTSRESALVLGLLREYGIILDFENTSLSKLGSYLTGCSAEVLRKSLSYYLPGSINPDISKEKDRNYWENIHEKFQAMADYAKNRISIIEKEISSENKEESERRNRDKNKDEYM